MMSWQRYFYQFDAAVFFRIERAATHGCPHCSALQVNGGLKRLKLLDSNSMTKLSTSHGLGLVRTRRWNRSSFGHQVVDNDICRGEAISFLRANILKLNMTFEDNVTSRVATIRMEVAAALHA
jgi:hypothetical protein